MFLRVSTAITLCAFAACGSALPAQAPAKVASIADIKATLLEDCAAGRFSGIVVAVQKGETVLRHMCGYADYDAKTPITEDTRYKIFSLSKSFTGTAVTLLVERGKIDLDAPVKRYVADVPEAWSAVSVRHLLNHLSGIPDLTNDLLDAYLKQGQLDHDGAMRMALRNSGDKAALKSEPGSTWAYNNFGYELLATLIERVSGQSSAKFIENNIFKPAKMTGASVELPLVEDGAVKRARPSPGLAQGYNGEAGKLEPAMSYSFVQQGAGALHMGYRDLLAFNDSLANGHVLPRKSQSLFQSEAFPIRAGSGYGLGWLVRNLGGKTYFQHSGGTNGFGSDFARTADGENFVIILSNLGFAKVEDYRKNIMSALLAN